ncbi:related to VPS15 - ser/thr protein kinase [Melanopsichium pennsylvanicum]|uniref:non-specific serine/threonine protein kinase n=2 Tax=Melanopsichium pennsylvanicum TaxID=63383 RepID=A0AAJ4XI64_9BASI|nr:related to VPS15-ser/thr protein kinase [Melanopsichium pennsylvanicum 4]SNX82431.1 related to VPS15 - ser/thr protein kinase [Melanopsichium pennsylvanicum]
MAGIGNLVAEVGNDIQYDKGIGNSRFLRAVRALHRFGPIVVKTFVKPDSSMSLKSLVKHIRIERESLADVPNVLTYQKIVETERAGYLIRQWLHSNLYDRISTRPFLSAVEKRWITYQLLHAMRDAHERGIAHGDLKCENVLVTTSLMIYVTDFASSFKPTFVPLDDPSDFSFFFDTSGRRACYLAPERFYEAGSKYGSGITGGQDAYDRLGSVQADLLGLGRQSGKVTQAMDVFSLGCVIAELWREGAPTFTLSQLFKYREGMFDVDAMLADIPDDAVRELVKSMISLDPADRKTFEQYLADGRGTVFPSTILDFFHEYLVELQRTSPTALNQRNSAGGVSSVDSAASGSNASVTAVSMRSEATSRQAQRAESDERIEKLYEDWSTLIQFFHDPNDRANPTPASAGPSGVSARLNGVLGRFSFQSSFQQPQEGKAAENERSASDKLDGVFPVHLCIPGLPPQKAMLERGGAKTDGTAHLVLSVILSNVRNCIRPSSKCHALELLIHLSTRWLTDETKLDRVLPFIIALFDDPSSQVRMTAIRSCVQLLMLVKIVTPSNASIFPEYIMPNIKQLGLDPSTPVRCTFAACIVPFAETAERFLQMSQAMRAEGLFAVERDLNGGFIDDQPYESNYDEQLRSFQALLQEIIVTLLTDPSASVKRALLSGIAPLCRFFGMAKTNDVMLSHMITYLNDRNWLLREAFFDIIVDVAEVSGNRSLEEYILPLMTQALSDSEEHVAYRVINGLRSMTERNLLNRAHLLSLLEMTIGFLCHPNLWLRQASAGVISAAAARLEDIDVWAIVYPSLRPLLRADVQNLDEITLLDMAKAPLTRPVFSAALVWASQASNSAFWKSSAEGKDQAGLKNGLATEGVGLLLGNSGRELIVPARGRTEEDDRFRDKLRSVGMEDEDEVKLVALRSIIRRLSWQGSKINSVSVDWDVARPPGGQTAESGHSHSKAVIEPQSLEGTTPQTIFFNSKVDQRATPAASEGVSTYTGILHSQDDATFSAQVAKRRLLGQRTSSESSFSSPIAGLRRRMTAVSMTESQPSTFSTRLSSLAEEHAQSKILGNPVALPSTPLPQQTQTCLGVGKATAAVASTAVSATGTMTEASARARALRAEPAQASNKPAPSESRASTVRGAGGTGEALKPGAVGAEGGTSFSSTYDGNDPYIRAHLEVVYLDSFLDRPEFGPKIHAGVARRKSGAPFNNRASILPRAPSSSMSKRRPEGRLIAYFTEHSAAVTCLALSPDHAYFVSGSQDGTLKVWDTARLEKNVTSKSRATYSAQKGSITGVIAIEASHCVASTATDGSLHVWRIDMIQTISSIPRYGRPKLVSNFQLSTPDEYATCLVESSTETSSYLILGTTLSRLTILDLRTMQVLQTLRNPVDYGPITCLCVDRKKTWLLVGTLSGIISLWDLRFGLRLRAWHVGPSEAGVVYIRVNRIAIHPSKGRGRWVLVAFEKVVEPSGGDMGVEHPEVIVETWDIDRGIRVETFETQQDAMASSCNVGRDAKLRPVLDSVGAGHAEGMDDSSSSNHTMKGTTSRHGSLLTGAAAAIERLLQQQQQKQTQFQSRDHRDDAGDVDPFATTTTTSQKGTASTHTTAQVCSVKALFVSLEGYSSSSLSSATVRPSDTTPQPELVMDGTETIHAETGGGWLDVGKLTRATDRMATSSPAAAAAAAATTTPAANEVRTNHGGGSGPGGYMITAGSDARLRFWDLGRPEKSLVFGLSPRVVPASSLSTSSFPTSASLVPPGGGGAMVSIDAKSHFRTISSSSSTMPLRFVHSMWYDDTDAAIEANGGGRGGGVTSASGNGTRLKSPLLANQTAMYANMSRAHKDAVTDVLVIEAPFRCVVAADRSGCIRVWE